MGFIEQYFKDKKEIKPEDIELFVSRKIEENINLDYKDIKHAMHVNSDPTDNRDENLIVLCPNHHVMADRGKIDRKACRLYKEGLMRKGIAKQVPLKELAQIEGIDVEPETMWRKWLIRLGRKYVSRRYGKLDVSLNREKIGLFTVGLLCFAPLIYQMYQLYTSQIVANTESSLIALFLIIVGMGLIVIVFALERLKCPNCYRNFGIRRADSKRVEEKEVYRTETEMKIQTVYHNTYECEFCGYKVTKFESESKMKALYK